jgi:DNA-binding GntR family transcriptional regulator
MSTGVEDPAATRAAPLPAGPTPAGPTPVEPGDLATVLARRLDRSSPVPLYFQLAEQLRGMIADGTLVAGTRLENEVALAQRLGLSRPTVRQALQELVQRGALVRRRGVGTQVVHPRVSRSMALTSLHDDLATAGQQPRTDLLEQVVGPVPPEVTEAMGLPEDAEVLTLRRLRYADGEPLALMTNHVPVGLVPDPARLATEGLYQCLRDAGVHLRVAHQRVGARLATAAEARLLHERPRAALVTMERTAYDDAGAVVEHGQHVYRASRYSFETTLVER